MIPITDDAGPGRRFPFVNYALILSNVVVFVLELNYGDCFIADHSTIPAAIVHGAPATIQGCPIGQPSFVYLTLLTSMFLHANLLHIGGNTPSLFFFCHKSAGAPEWFWSLWFHLFCGLGGSRGRDSPARPPPPHNLGDTAGLAAAV